MKIIFTILVLSLTAPMSYAAKYCYRNGATVQQICVPIVAPTFSLGKTAPYMSLNMSTNSGGINHMCDIHFGTEASKALAPQLLLLLKYYATGAKTNIYCGSNNADANPNIVRVNFDEMGNDFIFSE